MIHLRKPRTLLKRIFVLALLSAAFAVLPGHAQAPAGYTKIASVTTTSYTDTTGLTSGEVNNYCVTATNAAGESAPSNIVTATTPSNLNPHSNALSWTAPATGSAATGYNVYRLLVTVPNAPSGLSVISQ